MASSDEDKIYGTLSNFEIEKKIGRGQFSVVYRAKCLANDQIVALKKVQVGEWNDFSFKACSTYKTLIYNLCSFFAYQIFDMMDAKARQDCIKEIELLKVE